MDFSLTQAQQMLKQSAREFLEKECPRSLVRALESDPLGYSPELWKKMAELGWLGLVFPEEHGGSGGDFLDLALLLEEMGYALVPGPFFSTVVLFGLAVLEAASPEQKSRILPALCRGELIGTAALDTNAPVRFTKRKDKYILTGEYGFVPSAHIASAVLVSAARRGQRALFLLSMPTGRVEVKPLKTLSGDKLCCVRLSDVEIDEDWVIGEVGEGRARAERGLGRAAVGACAMMVGGMQAVLGMTVAYVKERTSFGKPIGSYQAIQHHCADMNTYMDTSRFLTYQAAWRIAKGLPAAREVHMAKAYASKAYQRVCLLAHQCHGAMGFSYEHDLQLYTRRAKALEMMYGDASHHLQQAASGL
jgi:alkylation response protein AidB-like acyl-CoA dehydrogenase